MLRRGQLRKGLIIRFLEILHHLLWQSINSIKTLQKEEARLGITEAVAIEEGVEINFLVVVNSITTSFSFLVVVVVNFRTLII